MTRGQSNVLFASLFVLVSTSLMFSVICTFLVNQALQLQQIASEQAQDRWTYTMQRLWIAELRIANPNIVLPPLESFRNSSNEPAK